MSRGAIALLAVPGGLIALASALLAIDRWGGLSEGTLSSLRSVAKVLSYALSGIVAVAVFVAVVVYALDGPFNPSLVVTLAAVSVYIGAVFFPVLVASVLLWRFAHPGRAVTEGENVGSRKETSGSSRTRRGLKALARGVLALWAAGVSGFVLAVATEFMLRVANVTWTGPAQGVFFGLFTAGMAAAYFKWLYRTG